MQPKREGIIRLSGCNPNGIKDDALKNHLQHSMDLDIDIQCYSEVNTNFQRPKIRKKFYEQCNSMDRNSKSTWGTSETPCDSDFKPGWTGIITRGSSADRIKRQGYDKLGRWTWQLLNGEGSREVLVISVYQCCRQSNLNARNTASRQQQIHLSEDNRADIDPRFFLGKTSRPSSNHFARQIN